MTKKQEKEALGLLSSALTSTGENGGSGLVYSENLIKLAETTDMFDRTFPPVWVPKKLNAKWKEAYEYIISGRDETAKQCLQIIQKKTGTTVQQSSNATGGNATSAPTQNATGGSSSVAPSTSINITGDTDVAPVVDNNPEVEKQGALPDWQQRIKDGNATDEDIQTAYDAWHNGQYQPGEKTMQLFQKMEGSQPEVKSGSKQYDLNATMDSLLSGQSQKGDYEAYKQGQIERKKPDAKRSDFSSINDPSGDFQNAVDNMNYKTQQGLDSKSNYYNTQAGVNGRTGEINGYTNIFNEGRKLHEAGNNYRDVVKDETGEATDTINGYKDMVEKTNQFNNQKQTVMDRIYGKVQNGLDSANQQKQGNVTALQNQLNDTDKQIEETRASINSKEHLEPDRSPEAWTMGEDGNLVPDTGAERYNFVALADTTEDKQKLADLTAQRDQLNEKLSKVTEIMQKGEVSDEDLAALKQYGITTDDLESEIMNYQNAITQINSGELESMASAFEKYGDDEDKATFEALQTLNNSFADLTASGKPLTEDELNEVLGNISTLEDYIENEKKNNININEARDAYRNQLNKFAYFLFDDLKTAIYCYAGWQLGNFTPLYSALEKRNAAFNESETKYKTDILDSFSQANKADITGDSDATYSAKQLQGQLELAIDESKITAQQKKQLTDGLIAAYESYQKYVSEHPDDDAFRAWFAMQSSGALGGWAGIVQQAVKVGALNWDALKKMFDGDTEQTPDSVKPGAGGGIGGGVSLLGNGRANNWIDTSFNNALGTQSATKAESNPAVSLDKQSTVMASLQRGQQQPIQLQPQQPDKTGWGASHA